MSLLVIKSLFVIALCFASPFLLSKGRRLLWHQSAATAFDTPSLIGFALICLLISALSLWWFNVDIMTAFVRCVIIVGTPFVWLELRSANLKKEEKSTPASQDANKL